MIYAHNDQLRLILQVRTYWCIAYSGCYPIVYVRRSRNGKQWGIKQTPVIKVNKIDSFVSAVCKIDI